MIDFSFIEKLLNLSPLVIATLGITALLALFNIDAFFLELSTLERIKLYRYLSFTVAFSLVYIILFYFVKAWPYISKSVIDFNKQRNTNTNIKRYIKEIPKEELEILALFVYSKTKTIPLDRFLPSVRNLLQQHILDIGSLIGTVENPTNLRISDVALEYLNNNMAFFDILDSEYIESVNALVERLKSSYNSS
jgi:hypothetical protein